MLAPHTLVHNRYRIVRLMSQGKVDTLYAAVDEESGRAVALKQVLAVRTPEMDEFFAEEARLLGGLGHPALPPILDFFMDEAGQFLVMPFVPGADLATQLAARGKAFFLDQILRWTEQLLDVIEYLHSHHPPVLHRDIKPHNLKLGERGELLLLDVGLVAGSPLLRPHARTETSPYLPLEQLEGEPTTQQSDLYALAATLYHLATNHPPADALSRVGHLTRQQPDPLRPPREINPLLPITFATLLTRALSLTPAERPSSAQAMRFALYEEKTGKAMALPVIPSSLERTVPYAEKEPAKPDRRFSTPAAPPPRQGGAEGNKGHPPFPRSQSDWYVRMGGAAVALLLLGGGAWWLAENNLEGGTLPPAPTRTPTAIRETTVTPTPRAEH